MLTEAEIDGLARRVPVDGEQVSRGKNDLWPADAIREAVRMTAERCADLCDEIDMTSYPRERKWPHDCAAAIRERIKDKPRPPFDPNQGFGPI